MRVQCVVIVACRGLNIDGNLECAMELKTVGEGIVDVALGNGVQVVQDQLECNRPPNHIASIGRWSENCKRRQTLGVPALRSMGE
jgi:hypothetical protein